MKSIILVLLALGQTEGIQHHHHHTHHVKYRQRDEPWYQGAKHTREPEFPYNYSVPNFGAVDREI